MAQANLLGYVKFISAPDSSWKYGKTKMSWIEKFGARSLFQRTWCKITNCGQNSSRRWRIYTKKETSQAP